MSPAKKAAVQSSAARPCFCVAKPAVMLPLNAGELLFSETVTSLDVSYEGAPIDAQGVLPSLSDVRQASPTYSTGEQRRREGLGSVRGRPAVVKTALLSQDPSAAKRALTEVDTRLRSSVSAAADDNKHRWWARSVCCDRSTPDGSQPHSPRF